MMNLKGWLVASVLASAPAAGVTWDLPVDPWVDSAGNLLVSSTGQEPKEAVAHLLSALDCTAATDMASMGACAAQQNEVLDQRLNAVYKALLAVYEDGTGERFRAAQRAWIKLRDATCAFELPPDVAGVFKGMCIQRETARRIEQLYGYASEVGGNGAPALKPEVIHRLIGRVAGESPK